MTADSRNPNEIEAEIVAERSRLSRDLETLQDRLTVDNLMAEVKAQLRGQIDEVTTQVRGQVGVMTNDVAAGLRDQLTAATDRLGRTAKTNPWPFAVVGLGLAWLAVSVAKPERTAKRKPHVGMAPIKPATPREVSHYDSSPADMAAARLDDRSDAWADARDTRSEPIPPYDREPSWMRDDDDRPLPRR